MLYKTRVGPCFLDIVTTVDRSLPKRVVKWYFMYILLAETYQNSSVNKIFGIHLLISFGIHILYSMRFLLEHEMDKKQ